MKIMKLNRLLAEVIIFTNQLAFDFNCLTIEGIITSVLLVHQSSPTHSRTQDIDYHQGEIGFASEKRIALRRRHSMQQDEEHEDFSTLVATADDFEPVSKMPKPDSPGEASCTRALLSISDQNAGASTNYNFSMASFEQLPDELIFSV